MKVRVANPTKKDFDLHVAVRGIASRNCRRGQPRRVAGGGIRFCIVSSWLHGETCCPPLNIASEDHVACDTLRAVFATIHDILSKERPLERWFDILGLSCREL